MVFSVIRVARIFTVGEERVHSEVWCYFEVRCLKGIGYGEWDKPLPSKFFIYFVWNVIF